MKSLSIFNFKKYRYYSFLKLFYIILIFVTFSLFALHISKLAHQSYLKKEVMMSSKPAIHKNIMTYKNYKKNASLKQMEGIFIGTSLINFAIDPEFIAKTLNINSVVLGAPLQPSLFTYLELKDLIKSHKPKWIIIDTWGFIRGLKVPLGIIKFNYFLDNGLYKYLVTILLYAIENPYLKKYSYYDLFFLNKNRNKFNNGIKHLLKPVSLNVEEYYGNLGDLPMPNRDSPYSLEYTYITEEMEKINYFSEIALNRIIKLAEKKDISLAFLSLPFSVFYKYEKTHVKKVNYLKSILNKNNISIFETYRDIEQMGLKRKHFYEGEHLNLKGKQKFMEFFSKKYLTPWLEKIKNN